MALTRKFKETVQLRVKQDPEYRKELIIEATNAFLDGDISTGKTLLRDYLNATEALPAICFPQIHLSLSSALRIVPDNSFLFTVFIKKAARPSPVPLPKAFVVK
jgi:hypothetical protein